MVDGAWLELSARLQRVAARRTGRTDLVLRIAPGRPGPAGPAGGASGPAGGASGPAGGASGSTGPADTTAADGAWSGVFYPDLAEIRIDSRAVLDPGRDDPRLVDLSRADERGRYARLAGVVSLAAAHARHSAWAPPGELTAQAALAAQALEAARVLASHVAGAPGDRQWLRFAVPSVVTRSGLWGQVQSVCAAQAGLLTPGELAVARAGLAERAGDEAANRALAVIAAAVTLADGDSGGLLAAADDLVSALGQGRGQRARPAPGSGDAGSGDDDCGDADSGDADSGDADSGDADSGDGDDAPARLREETAAQAGALEAARQRRPPARTGPAHAARAADQARASYAAAAARDAFSRPRDHREVLLRQPGPGLRREARMLAGELRRARFRAEDVTRVPRGRPPGRLRLAEAMRREAQLAAGAEITARPWLEQRRRSVEFPRLTVGLSWDISRSRSEIHAAMADFAWVLARAVRDIGASMAAIAWNSTLTPVVWPGRVPDAVREPACSGPSTGCPQSLRALDGALGLSGAPGARMAVVATDGRIGNRRLVREEVASLAAAGVTVVWLTPRPDPLAPRGATPVVVPDTDRLIREVGRSISRELGTIDG